MSINHSILLHIIEDLRLSKKWKRNIQWKQVADEYRKRVPNSPNTPAFQKRLSTWYHKNKKKGIELVGKKKVEELIDLTQEKVVDSKGRPLKVGDLVRYIGDNAEHWEENGEDMDGTITEIKEDGTVMGFWHQGGIPGHSEHELVDGDFKKVLTKEERADEIRAVFKQGMVSLTMKFFRQNNLLIEEDLSIRDAVTKELVFKLFHYSGPVTFPVSDSYPVEGDDGTPWGELEHPISEGTVKLGDKTFDYEFGDEYADSVPEWGEIITYFSSKEDVEDHNMDWMTRWDFPDIDHIEIDFGNYDVKVEGGTYAEGEIRLSEPHSGSNDVTLNIELIQESSNGSGVRAGLLYYYNRVREALYNVRTVEQYEEAISIGAHVGMLVDFYGRNVFVRACLRGSIELIDPILQAHPNLLNSQDGEGDTGLAWAAYKGHVEVVKKLLKYPDLDVNKTNKVSSSAFMEAFRKNYVRVMRVLLTDKRTEGIVTIALFRSSNAGLYKENAGLYKEWLDRPPVHTQGPISLDSPIVIPVRCRDCRRLFEARELHSHLENRDNCPLCRKPMNTLEFLTDSQIHRWNRMEAATVDEESKIADKRKEIADAKKTIEEAPKEITAAQVLIKENALKNRFRQFVVKKF
tara:strand:- start:2155 stop:4047 length:1893 start_codon:yes stop_codon:yes gene_type:complete